MRARRLVALLPVIAFAATFGVFIVHKNREARTVLRSGRGLLVSGVIVVGYVAIAWLARRVKWWWVAPVVSAGVVIGLAAWIVRPYYVDETVNRVLVSGPIVPAADVATTVPPTTVATDPPTTEAPAPPSTSAAAPASATQSSPTTNVPKRTPPTTRPAAVAPPPAPTTTAAPTAVRISTGNLSGRGHHASGRVGVIDDRGRRVVRFEDFEIEGTPDPRVYVVPRSNADRPDGGYELGRLSGNRGAILDYAVPAGAASEVGPGWTVLVWCRAFSVPIAVGSQSA